MKYENDLDAENLIKHTKMRKSGTHKQWWLVDNGWVDNKWEQ